MSRTLNTVKNIKYSTMGQIISLFSNFLTRLIFVKVLSGEHLGLNGLFSNILSILSFAELGIGPAIVYSMYKPLAEKDELLLKGLMNLYKRVYILIGIIILVCGSALTPFLAVFIKDMPEIDNIRLIYILFVVNSASSYLFSYKRSFLIADQKQYIESIYHYSYLLLRNVLQSIGLIITKNFIVYLTIQIFITVLENLVITRKVNIIYPFIKNTKGSVLNSSVKDEIVKNVKAMVFHKTGSILVMGTDNLLIAKFIGIIEVGLYSNYLFILNALNQIFSVFFQSVIASVGNLGTTESSNKNEFIFRCIDFVGLWIYGFASIALITLLNPFISLWLGNDYVFSLNIVLLIVPSFYLTGRRKSILAFRDALGLFWYDRHKPIFETIINLTASIYLVSRMGLAGIILGTIISTLLTSFWIEPFVLYKYGFKLSVMGYILRYWLGTSIITLIGLLNFWLVSFFGTSLVSFLVKVLITGIFPNLMFIIIFWKRIEFQYLFSAIKPVLLKFSINAK